MNRIGICTSLVVESLASLASGGVMYTVADLGAITEKMFDSLPAVP